MPSILTSRNSNSCSFRGGLGKTVLLSDIGKFPFNTMKFRFIDKTVCECILRCQQESVVHMDAYTLTYCILWSLAHYTIHVQRHVAGLADTDNITVGQLSSYSARNPDVNAIDISWHQP